MPGALRAMAAIGSASAAPRDGLGGATEVATAFATEFARLGYSAPRIMRLFRDPFYTTAHAALRDLGEPMVREVVATALAQVRPLAAPLGVRRAADGGGR
jgi:hypothetical protein